MHTDFHIHTHASDGLDEPIAILEAAKRLDIEYLAITDHDTVAGALEARQILEDDDGERFSDITLLPGIEISTSFEGRDVHMLGYYVDLAMLDSSSELRAMREARKNRSFAIADRLNAAGYPISSEELAASGATVNRTAIARRLVECGAVKTTEEAFNELIGDDSPFYVARGDMETVRAIELIGEAGGLAVIAHPWLYKVTDLIEPLMEYGLAGVEAFHSEHPEEECRKLATLATSLGLLVTGGSDWHGDKLHSSQLGQNTLPETYLEAFLAADPR